MVKKSVFLLADVWAGKTISKPSKAKRAAYRLTPASIRRPLVEAIEHLEALIIYYNIDSDCLTILREYRANQSSGVMNPFYIARMNREYPILMEGVAKVVALGTALDNYRPEENMTEGVYRLAQGSNATHERPNAKKRQTELQKIGNYLKKVNYKDSAKKEELKEKVAQQFGCSKSTVSDAAKLAGLTRNYKQSPI